jgi:hypothetical protein
LRISGSDTLGAGRIIIADRSAAKFFKRQYDPVNSYVAIPTLQRNTTRGTDTNRDRKDDYAHVHRAFSVMRQAGTKFILFA